MAFDVISPTPLGAGEAAVSPSFKTYRTTPTRTRDLVKDIDIANNAGTRADVSVHLVASGDSPTNENILFPTVSVDSNTVVQWSGLQVIDAGATIQAQASIADVCVTISGGNAV